MEKIYVRTYAYNAEKTVGRAIESILNQTYENFEYYICDNGSTDRTGEIIQEYAAKDKRIKFFHNKINRAFRETEECLFLPYNIKDDEYFCTLDADDEYLPTFFEEVLKFMKEYNLDVAACGNDFVDVQAGNQVTMQRILKENLILENTGFADHFPKYHCFMRTTWGKLYKASTLKNTVQDVKEDDVQFPRWYGGDTYNTMKSFSDAKRAGIYNKSLHRYYVYPKSSSYQYRPERIKSAELLFEAALQYLKPYGVVSGINLDFAYLVYMNDVIDTLKILFNSKLPQNELINGLYDIFLSDYTKLLIAHENLGMYIGSQSAEKNKTAIISRSLEVLLNFKNIEEQVFEKYYELGTFLSAAIERADLWLGFNKLYIGYLLEKKKLDEASIKIEEFLEFLPEDKEIQEFSNKLRSFRK